MPNDDAPEVDARLRMILVAERLFAERGVGAVALREIGAAAGQRNNSAVQYHFGSKDGLVAAVFEHRMGPIDARRWAMLAEIDREGGGDDLRVLVDALVRPLAEAIVGRDEPSWYARLIAQVLAADGGELSESVAMSSVAEVFGRMDACLADLVPHRLRMNRLRLAGFYVVNTLAERERVDSQPASAPGLDLPAADFVHDLIDTTVGLLRAPSTPTGRRRKASTASPARRRTRPPAKTARGTRAPHQKH